MLKAKKPQDTIGIQIEIPKELSLKLARHILDLSEIGIRATKADLIIKYARIGLNEEIKKNVE